VILGHPHGISCVLTSALSQKKRLETARLRHLHDGLDVLPVADSKDLLSLACTGYAGQRRMKGTTMDFT